MKPRKLFETYSKCDGWKDVSKSSENSFMMGSEAVLLRGSSLLHEFFNHKSDANKYLDATKQEDLEKEFGEWCAELATPEL